MGCGWMVRRPPMARLRQPWPQVIMASQRLNGIRNLARPCPVVSARVAPRWIFWELNQSARDSTRRCVQNAHRVCAVAGVLDTPTPAFQPGVVLSLECQTGRPRMQCSQLGIATEENSRYRALTRRAYGQTTRDRRCGLGWTAVRCSGPLVGHTANTTRHVAPPGCRYWRPDRSRDSGAKQGRIQLRLHRLRLRYWDAPSLQWRARVLRVHPGHAWRSRGLLEPG
jgi:hypothetical protein